MSRRARDQVAAVLIIVGGAGFTSAAWMWQWLAGLAVTSAIIAAVGVAVGME